MKITTLNVNGLRSAERRGFSAWLDRHAPDVLCLQEVRADLADLPGALREPAGWHVAWNPAKKKGYAGTAVWSRAAPVRVAVGLGHPRAEDEGRVVGMQLADLDVWSVYLPSGSSRDEEEARRKQAWKDEFMARMEVWLDERLASGRPTLVCGDLNIAHTAKDIRNAKANEDRSGFLPHERRWLDGLLRRGWRDTFRELHPERVAYSWWSNRGQARANDVGWRIDHVWASPGVDVRNADIERHADLSDHAPVSVEIGR